MRCSCVLRFFGTMCLWNGLMQIAAKTSLQSRITRMLRPVLKFLFPELKEGEQAYNEISMNMVANIMGLGNAATPLGLKAMESLQKKNSKKDTLSNSMAMLIVLNTASLQIIPTTVIAIRTSLRKYKSNGNYCACVDCNVLCSCSCNYSY